MSARPLARPSARRPSFRPYGFGLFKPKTCVALRIVRTLVSPSVSSPARAFVRKDLVCWSARLVLHSEFSARQPVSPTVSSVTSPARPPAPWSVIVVLCFDVLCNVVIYCAVLCCGVLWYGVLCCIVLCCVVVGCVVLC